MAEKKLKLDYDELKQSVHAFAVANTRSKRAQTKLAELKKQFYSEMEEYFKLECLAETGASFDYEDYNNFSGTLTVTRVQKATVVFDPDKLVKTLGKDVCEDIVLKRYEITDMSGLITYLKECGVDPNIFKSFIEVTKSVNTQELDRLEEVGEITAKQIEGCYTTQTADPYFVVKVKKGQGGED